MLGRAHMNRFGIVLALVLAPLSSVACAVSSDEEPAAQTEDALQIQTQTSLTCHRFPTDTCVSVGTYCRNHGGQLVCDLAGNCTCVYSVFQSSTALAP